MDDEPEADSLVDIDEVEDQETGQEDGKDQRQEAMEMEGREGPFCSQKTSRAMRGRKRAKMRNQKGSA